MNKKLDIIADKNSVFWTTTKDCKWNGDVTSTQQRLFESLGKNNLLRSDYRKTYDQIFDLINNETMTRVNNGKESFEHHHHRGGDDSHFFYLPAEIISRGYDCVNDYLNGGMFDNEAHQCFSYIL